MASSNHMAPSTPAVGAMRYDDKITIAPADDKVGTSSSSGDLTTVDDEAMAAKKEEAVEQDEKAPAPGGRRSSESRSDPEPLQVVSDPGAGAGKVALWRRILGWVFWVPPKLRWDPNNPPEFTGWLNLLYAVTATFTVANLYYCQPILYSIADHYGVSDERASSVAALTQAGYATGLLFICPLGDMVKRRPAILTLIMLTSCSWLVVCLAPSFTVFLVFSYLAGVTTVTPQMLIPLVGEIARVDRKGSALSIVGSGMFLGMLIARLLSGVVANFTSWINIYWFSLGMQAVLATLLFFFMPDYPAVNTHGVVRYWSVHRDIIHLLRTEPLLVQTSIVSLCICAGFTSFWTTLSFLLSSPPYNYNSLVIGLFAFIGIVAILLGPVFGRLITDRFTPWYSSIAGLLINATGITISVIISPYCIAGPILHALGIDLGLQLTQVANRAALFLINPKARSRINTAYTLAGFFGQLIGTAVGNRLYAQGGWRWSSGASVGLVGLAILVTLLKGPREPGWVGWSGSWAVRGDHVIPKKGASPEGKAEALEGPPPPQQQQQSEKVDQRERESGEGPTPEGAKAEEAKMEGARVEGASEQ